MLLTVSHDWTWYFFEQRICQNPHNYSICRVFHSLKKENHTVESRLRTQPLCFFHFLSCPFRFLLFYFLCMFVLFSYHDLSFSSHAPFVSFRFLSFPFVSFHLYFNFPNMFFSISFISIHFLLWLHVPCSCHSPFMLLSFSFHVLAFSFHVLFVFMFFSFLAFSLHYSIIFISCSAHFR